MSLAAADADRSAAVVPSRSRLPLYAALAACAAWWIVLAIMAVLTSDPVTLNRDQIARAAYVVSAVVDDPRQGRVTVVRAWKGGNVSGPLVVENLAEAAPVAGATYLLALTRVRGDFRVADTLQRTRMPLIYPATPEALEQLRSILAQPG